MEDREFDEFIGKEFDPNPCVGVKKEGFDPLPHLMNNLVLRCGRVMFPKIRELRALYLKTCEAVHMAPIQTTSAMANRYPPPQETAPVMACPKCGKMEYRLYNINSGCGGCKKESEDGKYNTKWWCHSDSPPETGCGHMEKSEMFLTQWYNELKVEYGNQTKESLGVKTITDEGVK